MKDQTGREIDYMRISITDRCNLRCKYCMPGDIEATDMANLTDIRGNCKSDRDCRVTWNPACPSDRWRAVSAPWLCRAGQK